MSDLRARIAAVVDGHVECWDYDCCCTDGAKHIGEWAQHVADAIIRELGLQTIDTDGDIGTAPFLLLVGVSLK